MGHFKIISCLQELALYSKNSLIGVKLVHISIQPGTNPCFIAEHPREVFLE